MLRSCLNTTYLIHICDDHCELSKVIYHVAKLEVLCLLVAKNIVQRDGATTLWFLEHLKVSAPYLQKLGWSVIDHYFAILSDNFSICSKPRTYNHT